ncbi:hypothetical protein ACFU8Q_05640 [Streptomyces sp. NPDC057543]|uniref:hypothetical protein n=1 Tax=Streptomyces sp. NPDC057543 TaxID=3346163 RepID=UPI00369D22CB
MNSVVHIEAAVPGRSGVTAAIESRPDREQEVIAFRLKELRAGMETTLQGIKTLAEEGGRSGWEAVVRRRFAPAAHGLICR